MHRGPHLFDPGGRAFGAHFPTPGGRALMSAGLETTVGSLRLKNPVMPASGTYDWFGRDPAQVSAGQLGAVVTKSVTLEPQKGAPPTRVAETPLGMLNAIGIPSVGLDTFMNDVLPKYRELATAVIVSVQAYSPEECETMAARLDEEPRVDALELNLSCPNLNHGTITAQSPELSAEMVAAARRATELPIVAKLSPNVTSIIEIARAVEESGADALCLINTLKGMAINVETRQALLGNLSGGLPTFEGATEFLLAGARAIQVGPATFREPRALEQVVSGLRDYLSAERIESVSELVGWCHGERNVVGS